MYNAEGINQNQELCNPNGKDIESACRQFKMSDRSYIENKTTQANKQNEQITESTFQHLGPLTLNSTHFKQ